MQIKRYQKISGLLILILLITGFSAVNDPVLRVSYPEPPVDQENYEVEWKKVDSLLNKGLPQSALEIAGQVYESAKNSDNYPQFIKAVIYKIRLNSEFREEFLEHTVADLKAEIEEAESPARQVLHSILAEIYWRYYQSNRNKFYSRTVLPSMNSNDISTWDLNALMDAVIGHYFASLESPDELKSKGLSEYDVILVTADGSKVYRPTLYDFLAHRAIDFFVNDESSIMQPAYRFELETENDFYGIEEFISTTYQTRDSLSLKFHALLIFQDLLSFHLNDPDPEALTDANLKRLSFVFRNSIHPKKDSLYLHALTLFEASISAFPSSAEVAYARAEELVRQGAAYNPFIPDDSRWKVREAKAVCEGAIQKFPDSEGGLNCKNLLASITRVGFRINTEKENIPGASMLALLSYKNLSQLHFRLVKLDYKEHREMLRDVRQRTELLEKYTAMQPVTSWDIEVPDAGDFQEHSTEIKIPSMEPGYYLLLASSSAQFIPDSGTVSYQTYWVTNIGFISQGLTSGGYGIYMTDRKTGSAISGLDARLFYRTYDYTARSYQYREGGRFTSDENGYFAIPPLPDKEKPTSFFLEFNNRDDQYITDDRFYHTGYSPREEKKQLSTYFFTDRSIYRPGQTIYFKGIVIEKNGDERAVKEGMTCKIEFLDVNYQKISELELVTSEYGSFQGSFVVPHGTLNGRMTIRSQSGSRNVQVEEYRRPGFEIMFNPLEGSYKLGETVIVSGNAESFAGASIAGADVSYRVTRETFYPWRFGYYDYFPVRSSMEITNGTTTTDGSGGFTIEFEAIPDHTIPVKFQPAFRYTIHADVTDINNETQSGSTTVSVGAKALFVDLELQEIENSQTLKSIPFRTTNLNGQPVKANGRITISLLEEPSRLLREKLWKTPDVYVIDKESFIKDFPYDSYNNENNPDSLKVSKVIMQMDFDSSLDSAIQLEGIAGWKSGRYRISVQTADAFGTPVEMTRNFILFSPGSKKPPTNELNWFHVLNGRCEPGETAQFIIGSADQKVRVLYEVVHQEKVIHSEWLMISNEQRLLKVPVTEEHRGGFRVNLLFVKNNRIFNNGFIVDVPFTNKQLDFEFLTFRNELIPGQDEEWSIKIKGKGGEKVAAELLTAMYDQSLDKFIGHNWNFNIFSMPYHGGIWNVNSAFRNVSASKFFMEPFDRERVPARQYDQLNWFGFYYFGMDYYFAGGRDAMGARADAMPGKALETAAALTMGDEGLEIEMEDTDTDLSVKKQDMGLPDDTLAAPSETVPQIRRDFRETAFFYPELKTDENGDVIIRFKTPESLTRWRLMGLAHTQDLKTGKFEKEIITSKELMVIPNPPRFFRQKDQLEFAAKIVNLSDDGLGGEATIRFFNAYTMQDITSEILTGEQTRSFNLEKGGSAQVSWPIAVPEKYDMLSYRVSASSASHTDAEERTLPVLTNRMLVTETLPLPVKGSETKVFTFGKLENMKTSSTLVNHKLTLEFSSNPAWYAVQALPYMMEGAEESADNIFNRFYANAIASYIVNYNPRIKEVFETWKNFTPDAFLSNLEKNEELKSLILNETPWVRDAQNEKERKQRIAVLFDMNKMADEKAASLRQLIQKQSPGGGWSWFRNMPDSRHITQQIISGFGHLKQLGVFDAMKENETRGMMVKALRYLDEMIREDYERLLEFKTDLEKNNLGNIQIQYLYGRAFFAKETEIPVSSRKAVEYYLSQEEKYWNVQGLFQKSLISVTLKRNGLNEVPGQILASLKEYALYSEEMGMYWRDNRGGFFWYEAPIETQAYLIEAFHEVSGDEESIGLMKVWLLKQKQTQNWKTPRATAAAVYALLIRGGDWLKSDKLAEITVGNLKIDPFELEDCKVEAGTGYFKTSWSAGEITTDMATVKVVNENPGIAWGALYWQYFEDLDKISFAETPLSINKKLFVKKNTEAGPVLLPLEGIVKTGDMVVVRIEIRVDRDMEYVHMKDMRASAFEPVNVISGYRYQGGLGYYESTLDASTNFFFDYMRKGTYVFEYPMVASQKGDFSNGVTTIQCLYAPEYTSHSEGIRIRVD